MVKKERLVHQKKDFDALRRHIADIAPGTVFERDPATGAVTLHLDDSIDPTELHKSVEKKKKDMRKEENDKHDPLGLLKLDAPSLEKYIDDKVVDIATAKHFLKRLSKIVLWLYEEQLEDDA